MQQCCATGDTLNCGSTPLSATTHTTLSGGHSVTFTGWSHTRSYAKGYLCNGGCSCDAAPPTATVTGLDASGCYAYSLYLYRPSGVCTTHTVAVNGGSATGLREDSVPTANYGKATATASGQIAFAFTRDSGCGGHIQFSGIDVQQAYDCPV